MELTVSKIMYSADSYREWLKLNGIQKIEDPYDYFYEIIKKEQPDLADAKLISAVEKAYNERYFEYYDYYYLELDRYLKEICVLQPYNPEAWFYAVKNIDIAKYVFVETDEYFKAVQYKEAYGKYPTLDTLRAHYDTLPDLNEEIDRLYKMYEREFEMTPHNGFDFGYGYLVSENDYIALSKQVGETDETARPEYYETEDYVGSYDACYTVIHSTNPNVTERFLHAEFPDHTTPYSYLPAMITPNDQFNTIIKDNIQSIVTSLITMAVILVVMSICMYFIMRSALMSRIKEIGIYRAIGVSKKNLIFRFAVEALVLATLTVFVGYLCTSAFIAVCIGISPLVKSIFFYPFWMALFILFILYALCLFCGTLPITLLLRKTPSQILAKYDI